MTEISLPKNCQKLKQLNKINCENLYTDHEHPLKCTNIHI